MSCRQQRAPSQLAVTLIAANSLHLSGLYPPYLPPACLALCLYLVAERHLFFAAGAEQSGSAHAGAAAAGHRLAAGQHGGSGHPAYVSAQQRRN